MLQRLWNAAELAAAPPDEAIPSRTRPGLRQSWVYGYNLSSFVFEIQNENGNVEGLALSWAPFKIRLDVRTEKLIIHKSGTDTRAAALAAADLAFYITVSEFEPDLIPGPW